MKRAGARVVKPRESRGKRDVKTERWLEGNEDGDRNSGVVFNPNAGPSLLFGAGPRRCFGMSSDRWWLSLLYALE